MRADVFLTQGGWAQSRTRAAKLIAEGAVTLDGRLLCKPSESVSEDQAHQVVVAPEAVLRYVSRGGLKLEAALTHFHLSVVGLTLLDVGASTGGFTDCLLQHGASRVFCVDSGRDQLHSTLRQDPRVRVAERTNARYLTPDDLRRMDPAPSFDGTVDGAVMDVSFISQTYLMNPVFSILREGAFLVSLIKPQFEVGPSALGKGGVVRREADRRSATSKVMAAAEAAGLCPVGVMPSPIEGGDGNREYLGYFVKRKGADNECRREQ